MSLRIAVRENGGRYRELPDGPFPLTKEQLMEARRRFHQEQFDARDDVTAGCRMNAASTARVLLMEEAPQLSMFDVIALSYAVFLPVRITEEVA